MQCRGLRVMCKVKQLHVQYDSRRLAASTASPPRYIPRASFAQASICFTLSA